jgi:lysyl-tRNA synthetase, class II
VGSDPDKKPLRSIPKATSTRAPASVDSRAMATLPKRFPDRVDVASVRSEADPLEAGEEGPEQRRVAGRVLARRGHGKLVFLDLVDRSGRIQLLVDAGRAGPVDLDLGDIVGATGRPAKTRRGEPSLAVDELELLAKIRAPLPDTFHGMTDVEQRYRRRYLDLLMNEETRADFETRTRMVTAIRRYLDENGFLEVETPILQPRYGGAFAEPFVTRSNALDTDLYLRIATELYLKRLIVGGLERVYEIGKDFRNEGVSYKHQPEFTMVEWYEAYADYRDAMARIEELIPRAAQEATGTTKATFRGHDVDLAGWRRVKLVDALGEQELWSRNADELRARLEERGVDTSKDRTWAQLVDHALSGFIEPSLIEPTILYDYPLELSPFARTTDDDPGMVERFEFFVGGMELGNAYSEINDPDEQADRFALQEAERAAGDATAEAGDPDYVEALSYGMPPTAGLGLGIERLALVLTGRDTIRDVVLFPTLRQRD